MADPVVISMMEFEGDPQEIEQKMGGISDLAGRKAAEYGGISSTVVKTDSGVMVINMWDSADGRHRMGEDPEIRQALQEAGMPPPSAKGYEVLSHRTAEHVTA
jgi:hypothetical protein